MFAVVGSGFGLYGYLPALVRTFREPVILPEAYRAKAEARGELRPYMASVRWARDVDAALDEATGVVLATVPSEQPALVERCCDSPRIERLVLEKPLAVTPRDAQAVIDRIERSGKRYRVGYTLLHAAWARDLRWPSGTRASIDWTFMAHHFARDLSNWKRDPRQGGGVIRFFGVHVLALLANYRFDRVLRSSVAGESERWDAEVTGAHGAIARIRMDSRSPQDRFSISIGSGAGIALKEPFEREQPQAGDDRRVPVLERVLASFEQDDAAYQRLYRAANALWEQAEAAGR